MTLNQEERLDALESYARRQREKLLGIETDEAKAARALCTNVLTWVLLIRDDN